MSNTWKIIIWIIGAALAVGISVKIFQWAESKINATIVSLGVAAIIYCVIYGFIWLADELEDWAYLIFNPKKLEEKEKYKRKF